MVNVSKYYDIVILVRKYYDMILLKDIMILLSKYYDVSKTLGKKKLEPESQCCPVHPLSQ